MQRLLCLTLIAAANAAAKFALERKGQKVLNVKLYETGYTFTNRGDKDKTPQTLREISSCSFGKKRDNGRREITLVEDKGYVITSSVLVKGDVFRYAQFDKGDDSVHVTLYSIAVLSLCALLVGVIAAAATHVAMKQKSVQMLERSKAPWQSYGSRDEEATPLIAKRPSLSFSV